MRFVVHWTNIYRNALEMKCLHDQDTQEIAAAGVLLVFRGCRRSQFIIRFRKGLTDSEKNNLQNIDVHVASNSMKCNIV